jgi:hypothetical protein
MYVVRKDSTKVSLQAAASVRGLPATVGRFPEEDASCTPGHEKATVAPLLLGAEPGSGLVPGLDVHTKRG